MTDLDKFALHSLQEVIERGIKAYDSFDFHVIYHSLYNYCTVGLSSFYLDILKDRLYTSNPESVKRRSAQTVMYYIVDAIAKIMAPILPFTSEEIWNFMPAAEKRSASIHLEEFPTSEAKFKNPALAEQWALIIDVRGEVTKVLENARVEKVIGHSLDASVTINVSGELYDLLAYYEKDLRSIFIVSELTLIKPDDADPSDNGFIPTEISGLSIKVGAAAGEKCQRCWIYDPSVSEHTENESICSRCQAELDSMG
jgi:isoleucyl-tRNA synthetase